MEHHPTLKVLLALSPPLMVFHAQTNHYAGPCRVLSVSSSFWIFLGCGLGHQARAVGEAEREREAWRILEGELQGGHVDENVDGNVDEDVDVDVAVD